MKRRPLGLVAAGVGVIAVTVALLMWGTAAGSSGPSLKVTGAYVPQPASPDVAAAYFTVTNSGDRADTLTGVTTDVSGEAMLHRSTGESMGMVMSLTIPAHGSVTLRPGDYHVMIEKPRRSLRQGDRVRLTLTFAHSAPITVSAPVMPVGYRPE